MEKRRSDVYRYIYKKPPFDDAVTIRDERWIDIVIIGLNGYGMEMLRAVLWFCQMDGFYLRVDVFDDASDIEERFAKLCPGVVERGYLPRMGEDYYDIHFHFPVETNMETLKAELVRLPETSRILIDTNDEAANLDLASSLKTFFEGSGRNVPRICAVSSRKDPTGTDTIGSAEEAGQDGKFPDDSLLEKARALHSLSMDAESFETNEYYRRSSIATAMHQEFREKYVKDEETRALTEHRRWCAYMRSTEGYRYGTRRDDRTKRHPSLTPYANLSLIEKEKDRRLNRSDDTIGESQDT